MKWRIVILAFLFGFSGTESGCQKSSGGGNAPIVPPPGPVTSDIEYWITKSDQSTLLQKQVAPLNFGVVANAHPIIEVDSTQSYQSIDGFGFTLTGGSAELIN